jgi:hypothetical protein
VSGVSRNRGGFVKCVAIQKRLGIPALYKRITVFHYLSARADSSLSVSQVEYQLSVLTQNFRHKSHDDHGTHFHSWTHRPVSCLQTEKRNRSWLVSIHERRDCMDVFVLRNGTLSNTCHSVHNKVLLFRALLTW